ncbi:hypothetical protein MVEN_00117700 [Mycena venus]|uniref:DUF6532 domain-containing protein n=1 Tax=Mycena venus TaxID=2733690 RepID=A0A8H7DHM1_9AGAR|nr:hypothetical protein MVEN_00117700 [Mycena venus]
MSPRLRSFRVPTGVRILAGTMAVTMLQRTTSTTTLAVFAQTLKNHGTPSVDGVLYLSPTKLGLHFAILTEGVFQTGFPSTPISEPLREPPHPHKIGLSLGTPFNRSWSRRASPTTPPAIRAQIHRAPIPPTLGTSAGDRPRGRPRAKDLDDQAKEYTICAIDRYRCSISAELFFTDHTTEPVLVHRAWDETCEELGERLPLTPVIYKLCCGELKTKVRPLAEIMYGFKSDGARFAFKDPENKKGLFKHPIFQKACNAMWFANRRDEGPSHPEIFNLLPEEALAALLTTENTIDEYLTGIRTDVPFTANEY